MDDKNTGEFMHIKHEQYYCYDPDNAYFICMVCHENCSSKKGKCLDETHFMCHLCIKKESKPRTNYDICVKYVRMIYGIK